MVLNKTAILAGNMKLSSLTLGMKYNKYPEEKVTKIRPQFNFQSKKWIPRPIKTRLLTAKKIMGSNSPWIGYFFLANYENKLSRCIERFNPHSPYYQAWFGCYIMAGKNSPPGFENENYDLDMLSKIGIGDQTSWLKSFRVKDPIVEITNTKVLQNSKKYHPKAEVAFLGEMQTNSDLNINASNDWRYNQLFGLPKKEWIDFVKPHHIINLKGYYISWPNYKTNSSIILYGCLVDSMETKSGEIASYWNDSEKELKNMIYNTKIIEI